MPTHGFDLVHLRTVRERLGLTQREVARRARLSIDTVRLHEAGKRNANWHSLKKYAQTLGVRQDRLLAKAS